MVKKNNLKFDTSSLVGLTEDEALLKIKGAGLQSRITCRDGHYYIVTRDYHLDRVNLEVVKEKVTKAHIG